MKPTKKEMIDYLLLDERYKALNFDRLTDTFIEIMYQAERIMQAHIERDENGNPINPYKNK